MIKDIHATMVLYDAHCAPEGLQSYIDWLKALTPKEVDAYIEKARKTYGQMYSDIHTARQRNKLKIHRGGA